MKRTVVILSVVLLLLIGLVVGIATVTLPIFTESKLSVLGLEQNTGYYNILDYGAQPNQPSFDNAAVFNEIINDMGENGGTIYIPVGNFYIDSSIEIDRSYVSIIGDNSGLRSGVDGSNPKTQSGGGGAKLIVQSGVTAIRILDEESSQRISGITFRSFQIRGEENNGIGIQAVQDTDRVVIDDLVINHVGTGVQLHGADAASILNSWIAETHTSIILNGASQQASIVNNSLGAQPSGVTIEMENPQWFTINGNNIYPDGASNIRLYNPTYGTISSNTISSRYTGIIEFLANNDGAYGYGNSISGNTISINNFRPHPEKKEIDWGILHIVASNTFIHGNQINTDVMPEGYTAITIESGENNRISNNSIGVTHSSESKIIIRQPSRHTLVTDSIYQNEFQNDGGESNLNIPLPES
ncbi:NosD domain-containing protein [Amphibacillus cookii]|uniref:NosD domain-containing protein n=1 Tax=Amphibacillus cookii TaxID=767787 RepID=UPI001959DC91|nr:hypothetical protein [Amphibacillus cookii]